MSHPPSTANDARGKSLRILQVLEPSGGGSGRHFLDLCRGLKQRGHHVEAVYSPVRAEEAFMRELKMLNLDALHRISMKRAPARSDLKASRALRRIVKAGAFDIVHGHSSKAGALARLRLFRHHAAYVYTPHAFRTMDPTLGLAGRIVYGAIEVLLATFFTDRLICVSKDEFAHARSLGVAERKLRVIVNGVAPPLADTAMTVRASFGIPEDAFVFGFIGRLSPQKAPERLVEAFRAAASKLPHAYLIMVGTGELESTIRKAIAESGLQSRIRLTSAFTGPRAVPAFDVLVMPSRYEAMPYVMLEAAAAGKPIIATQVGGVSTVIAPEDTGIIVPNHDDTAPLAAAMVRIAQPALYRHMAQACDRARSNYGLDIMIDRTEDLYQELRP